MREALAALLLRLADWSTRMAERLADPVAGPVVDAVAGPVADALVGPVADPLAGAVPEHPADAFASPAAERLASPFAGAIPGPLVRRAPVRFDAAGPAPAAGVASEPPPQWLALVNAARSGPRPLDGGHFPAPAPPARPAAPPPLRPRRGRPAGHGPDVALKPARGPADAAVPGRPEAPRPVMPLLARKGALPGRMVDDVPTGRAEPGSAGTVAGRWPTLLADDPQWTVTPPAGPSPEPPAEPDDVLGAEQRGGPWTG